MIAIVLAIVVAIALGNGNIQFELYLVSLVGLGLLSNAGIVVSEDTFGPVSDNAAGIAEMSGEFEGEAGAGHGEPGRRRATPPRPSPRASPSARPSSPRVALFASYIQTIAENVKAPATAWRPPATCSTPTCRRRSSTWPTRRRSSAC